jgi:hypothetical protein
MFMICSLDDLLGRCRRRKERHQKGNGLQSQIELTFIYNLDRDFWQNEPNPLGSGRGRLCALTTECRSCCRDGEHYRTNHPTARNRNRMVTAMVSYSASAHWGLSMGKQDSIKNKPAPPGEGATVPASGPDVTPKMALASAEGPRIEPPHIESSPIGTTTIAAPRIALAAVAAPHIAPDIAEPGPASGEGAPGPLAAEETAPEPPAESAPHPRVNRFTMLAACLALAAAFGGMLGALAAFALARPQPMPVIAAGKLGSEEIQALKENVVQARVELAALKVSIDAGNRTATTQFTKIAERIERMERNAAEPAAKLSKAVETLERLSRAEGAASLKDLTGSIALSQPIAAKPGGLEGWVLRDVHHGTAFIEGRAGVIEVEQGDLVPGLGHIDAIRKQDGRWVVVTSKGTITAPR